MAVILEAPSVRREVEFLAAVRRSRRLHGSWALSPSTPEAFKHLLRRAREKNRASFFVCLKTGELVGVINVSEIVMGSLRSAYLGYYGFTPYSRKGYMRAGLTLVLDHAFRKLRLHRLEANIQPANEPSRALVRSLGFLLEGFSPRYLNSGGRWKDHERWAITAEDWKAKKAKKAKKCDARADARTVRSRRQ